MNTALSWIKAYVPDLDCTAQEYTDAMTLTGTKVEACKYLDKNLKKIVVGQILSIEKHPDADKLVVCQVDIGEKTLQIVTGAPNINVGDKVPVVLDGGKVAGGHDGGPMPEDGIKIKKGKLRGVKSEGMMCSIEELGSSRNMYPEAPEDGIYIFGDDAPVGGDAVELLGLHDVVFEYEITSNRVDCYSVLGIAREAAATFRKDFVPPVPVSEGNGEDVNDYASVEVVDTDLCLRYCGRVVKNIKIGPSPQWMQRRLAASGIRPINNLVDITNYVMEEYGQPMHAFDLDTVAGHKIIVKRANDGDQFQTLDGQMRTLDKDILMICDAEKEIGIAGIMGGENSKITDNVSTVLFESACFDGTNIRLSAKRLGLRTDASGKYEKGLDPNNTVDAINRACQLIEEFGCGEVVSGIIDVCSKKPEPKRIPFNPDKINSLLGTDISREDMISYFDRLEIAVDEEAGQVIAPTFRQDLGCEADIAEEVARFYGYENIPTTLPMGKTSTGGVTFKMSVEKIMRQVAEYCGFSQGMSYSFESPKVYDRLCIPVTSPLRGAIKILNPLGEDFSIMRTTSVSAMLTSLSLNFNRRNKNVKLYEMGNIYIPKKLPLSELPDERMQMTLGFYGDGDFFTMKGVVEEILDKLGIRGHIIYDTSAPKPYLHPGRQANVIYNGSALGYLGEVHPDVLDNYDIGTRAYIAVLDVPNVLEQVSFEVKYEGIAKYPAVTRDISIVIDKGIMVGEIEKAIEESGGDLLEEYSLFDIYEGGQIEAGKKSVAYTITFRAKDRTLEYKEVNEIMDSILESLKTLGAELRS